MGRERRKGANVFLDVFAGLSAAGDERFDSYMKGLGGYTDYSGIYEKALCMAKERGDRDIVRALRAYPIEGEFGCREFVVENIGSAIIGFIAAFTATVAAKYSIDPALRYVMIQPPEINPVVNGAGLTLLLNVVEKLRRPDRTVDQVVRKDTGTLVGATCGYALASLLYPPS